MGAADGSLRGRGEREKAGKRGGQDAAAAAAAAVKGGCSIEAGPAADVFWYQGKMHVG